MVKKHQFLMKPFTYWEDLGKPGIRVNSGQIKPGKWQKNIKTWDSGSWKTWEMGKMTWENLVKPGISTLWGRGHPDLGPRCVGYIFFVHFAAFGGFFKKKISPKIPPNHF